MWKKKTFVFLVVLLAVSACRTTGHVPGDQAVLDAACEASVIARPFGQTAGLVFGGTTPCTRAAMNRAFEDVKKARAVQTK